MASLVPHRLCCGSWACPRCAQLRGHALRGKLVEAQAGLDARDEQWLMICVTIDPKRWTPAAAFEHVRKTRAIYHAVREWEAAHPEIGRVEYLTKMELQKSGMPHWHILVPVPKWYRIRRPTRDGQGGEFDEFWSMGLSNVQEQVSGSMYVGKLAAYACKGAADQDEVQAGVEILRASGLPAKGVHWVHASQGFWSHLGVAPLELKQVGGYEDELTDDELGGSVVRCAERQEYADHAERVASCGWETAIVVEGLGLSVIVPLKRGLVGTCLEMEFGNRVERFTLPDGSPGPVVERVDRVNAVEVLGFFEFLGGQAQCMALWDRLPEIEGRLGLRRTADERVGGDVPGGRGGRGVAFGGKIDGGKEVKRS